MVEAGGVPDVVDQDNVRQGDLGRQPSQVRDGDV